MKQKYNRYISFSTNSPSLPKFRKSYISQHSKFVHSSWLIKEDLDREVTLNETQYTIYGLWDVLGPKAIIMLKPVKEGSYYLADSHEVANALGYLRMRNTVTGVEHNWDMGKKRGQLIAVHTQQPEEERSVDVDEDMEGEFVKYTEEAEEFVDPLIKALQDDIIDDGDISAH